MQPDRDVSVGLHHSYGLFRIFQYFSCDTLLKKSIYMGEGPIAVESMAPTHETTTLLSKKEVIMNDTEIVNLYWQRSEQAITETEQKYGRYCHTIAYNILGNREDTEECVNDTWMSAWNSMPDKWPERLGPFLARITRNFALTKIMRRRAQKRGGCEAELALDELEECLSSGFDLEKEIHDRELTRAIDTFIGYLPQKEQLAFVSRYWFFATEREIAERLGLSRSGVAAMLNRTRHKLKKFLLLEGLCSIRNE